MPVHFKIEDHVARITIDRPEVLNAVDALTERELENIWQLIENNRDVRAVVLTGGGERAFCTVVHVAMSTIGTCEVGFTRSPNRSSPR